MRFAIVSLFVALLLCWGTNSVAAEGAVRPNVLWLIAEDFGQHLGCYGTPEVFTPHLDELANQGVRYTRCFTTAPVCSASRSAFMTGMYQTTIGAHHHRTAPEDKQPLPTGVQTLPDWLRTAGYFTANVREFPKALGIRGTAKTDWNFRYTSQPFDSNQWSDLKQHQPFYAQVNFSETHRTFQAPPMADPAKVELPPYYPDHPVVRQDWAQYLDSASELDRKVGLILNQLLAEGLAENTIVVFFADHGEAHVRGKQFCYDSGLKIPLIIRWPQQLNPPADFVPGQVNSQLLSSLDLSAQLLDWAGLPKPEKMQGQVFLGANREASRAIVFGARDRCDETVFRFRTARDEQYRYIRNFTPDRPFLLRNDYKSRQYPVWNLLKELDAAGQLTEPCQRFLTAPTMPEEELYDTVADPHETVNLSQSDKPEHVAALQRLRAATEQWIENSNDQGRDDDYTIDPNWATGEPAPALPKPKQ